MEWSGLREHICIFQTRPDESELLSAVGRVQHERHERYHLQHERHGRHHLHHGFDLIEVVDSVGTRSDGVGCVD